MGFVSFVRNIATKKEKRVTTIPDEYCKIDLKRTIYDYVATQKRYEHLKKSEVTDMSDDNLENAVMSWIWNKFNKEWSDQYEIVQSLPKPCQDVYSCRTVFDEINNGGFNQLFFNSTGQFAVMAQRGFLALGAGKLSDIMKESVEIFNANKTVLEKYNDGKMESFIDSYSEELFDALDSKFYSECETCELDKLIIRYIKENADCFGD